MRMSLYSTTSKSLSSEKINFSYSILFHLATSYSSYFGGKKGISRNKTSFFFLMVSAATMMEQELHSRTEGDVIARYQHFNVRAGHQQKERNKQE